MKYFTLLLISMSVFASESTLTISEHTSFHNYNNRPMIKMQNKRKMHQLHKINEKRATIITKQETNEDVQSMKLTHSGKILKYLVKTKSYTLSINALDGKVSDKVKN